MGQKISYHIYRFSVKEWVLYSAQGVALCVLLDYLFYRSVWMGILVVPGTVVWLREKKHTLLLQRKRRLGEQFRDALTSLRVAMQAGYSLENAVEEAARDLTNIYGEKQDITREFTAMSAQIGLSIPAEDLFLDLGNRSGLEDIINFARVLAAAKRTGGDTAGILDSSARKLSDKIEVKKEIDAMVAAKRFEQTIMSAMPAGIILYLQASSPGFLDILYGSLFGVMVMTVCLGIYVLSFVLGRKIVAIEV